MISPTDLVLTSTWGAPSPPRTAVAAAVYEALAATGSSISPFSSFSPSTEGDCGGFFSRSRRRWPRTWDWTLTAAAASGSTEEEDMTFVVGSRRGRFLRCGSVKKKEEGVTQRGCVRVRRGLRRNTEGFVVRFCVRGIGYSGKCFNTGGVVVELYHGVYRELQSQFFAVLHVLRAPSSSYPVCPFSTKNHGS